MFQFAPEERYVYSSDKEHTWRSYRSAIWCRIQGYKHVAPTEQNEDPRTMHNVAPGVATTEFVMLFGLPTVHSAKAIIEQRWGGWRGRRGVGRVRSCR